MSYTDRAAALLATFDGGGGDNPAGHDEDFSYEDLAASYSSPVREVEENRQLGGAERSSSYDQRDSRQLASITQSPPPLDCRGHLGKILHGYRRTDSAAELRKSQRTTGLTAAGAAARAALARASSSSGAPTLPVPSAAPAVAQGAHPRGS